MTMKRILSLALLWNLATILCFSQITTKELPISIKRGILSNRYQGVINLPIPDMNRIHKEDSINEYIADKPQRAAVNIPVNYNSLSDGKWITLEDGSKLWQLSLKAEDAKTLNVTYSKFWIPEGGKFFVYNFSTMETIGAITSEYLLGDKSTPSEFSTGLIKGDVLTFEYYQPATINENPIIELSGVYYGYRKNNLGFGSSGTCQVNVNCASGYDWQFEKNAVARILIIDGDNAYWCTGSLLNNTNQNYSPLLLTADHCTLSYDAITNPNASNWIFYWAYETSECDNPDTEPNYSTTIGAILKANNSNSDFALFQLIQDPRNLLDFSPYYLGWDKSGNSGNRGVCIHHPKGDIKKISTVAETPVSTDYLQNIGNSHWKVTWEEGTTEGGSSGSPLLNAAHRVIGQLHGGYSDCEEDFFWGTGPNQPDWYGKISMSWTGNENNDNRRRLSYWLDPLGSEVQTIDGLSGPYISGNSIPCSITHYEVENLPTGCTVTWSLSATGLVEYPLPDINPYENGNHFQIQKTKSYAHGTLTANIYNGNNLVKILTKKIDTAMGFSGSWYQGNNTPTSLKSGQTYSIENGSHITLYSDKFIGKTVSYTNNGLILYGGITHNDSIISFNLVYFNGDIVNSGNLNKSITIFVTDSDTCEGYEFTFHVPTTPTPISSLLNIKTSGNDNTFTLESINTQDEKHQKNKETKEWLLEIIQFESGRTIIQKQAKNNSVTINKSGWKPGIYIAVALIDGKAIATKKITVK